MVDTGAPVGAAAMKINRKLSTTVRNTDNVYLIGSVVEPIFIDVGGNSYWNGKAIVRLVSGDSNEEKEAFVSNVMIGTGAVNIRPPVKGQQCLVKPVTVGSDTFYHIITFMSTALSGNKPLDKLSLKGIPQVSAGEFMVSASSKDGRSMVGHVYMTNEGTITIKNTKGNSILSLGMPKNDALTKTAEGNIAYVLDIGTTYHKYITKTGEVVENSGDDYTLNTENLKFSITEDIKINGKNLISKIMDTINVVVKNIILKVYKNVSQTIYGSLTSLIHGDKTEAVRGSLTETVTGSKTSTIKGDMTEDIAGNASKVAGGTCSIDGEEILLNGGDQPVACKGHRTTTTTVCPVLGIKIPGEITEGSPTVKADK